MRQSENTYMRSPNFLLYSITLLIIFLSISACCDSKESYQYVSENCQFINYNKSIKIANDPKLGPDFKVTKCVINTFEQSNPTPIQSYKLNKEDIFESPYGGYSIKPSVPLPTNLNWTVLLNDSLSFSITQMQVRPSGGQTMFCESFMCRLHSYKVNDSLIESNLIKLSVH